MQTLRKKQFLPALITLSFALNAFAQNVSLPSNPDEYDVPKYQAIQRETAQKLQNAQALLRSLEERLARANGVAIEERDRLVQLDRKIRHDEQEIRESQARIERLSHEGRQAQQEMSQIERTLPEIEKDLREEEARRDSLTKQLQSAQQNTERLEAVAQQKEIALQPLRQAMEAKRQEVAKLQGQLNDLKSRIQALQTERDSLNAAIAAKQARVNALPAEIQQASAEVVRTARVQDEAAAEFERLNAEALKAEEAAKAQPRNRELQRAAVQARNTARVAQKNVEVARVRNVEATKKETSLKEEQAGIAAAVSEAQGKLAGVQQKLQEANQQLNPVKAAEEAAQRELAAAKAELDRASPDANKARQEANQAREVAQTVKGVLAETEQKIARKMERGKELRHRFSELQRYIQENRQASQNERNRIAELSNEIQQVTRRYNRQVEIVRQADYEVQLSLRDRDNAAAVVNDAAQVDAAAASRLAQVEANLRTGIAVATEDGRADGSADGFQEGVKLGNTAGSSEGQQVGAREGRENGTRDGIAQARATGKEEGTKLGEAEGTRKGRDEGKVKGTAEGRERGRAEGLAEGYETGYAEGDAIGYKEGIAAGKASGAYEKGRAEGFAQGAQRATSEATAKGKAEGYRKAEAEFMNAELSDRVMSNRGASAASQLFSSRAWEGRNPRRNYPHPTLTATYNQVYDQSFTDSAAQAYEKTYAESYRTAYSAAYTPAYNDTLSRDYSKEQAAAKQEARTQASNAAFKKHFEIAYQEAYEPARQAARSAALPERKGEGKRDGQKAGFDRGKSETVAAELARGTSDGDRQGYEQTYAKAYDAAEAAGRAEGVDFFTRNAVLGFDGAIAVDANDDGVFAPGEAVFVTVAIKNFGKAAQKAPVQVVLASASGELTVEKVQDTLVPLPGQTRSVVTSVGGLRISTQAEPGSRLSAQVSVVQEGKVLGRTNVSFAVGFPYSVATLEAPEFATPDRENEIRVQVRNASSKASASDVAIRLVSFDPAAELGSPDMVAVGRIASGESKAAAFSFVFSAADAFKVMRFEIQVIEGGMILGRRAFTVNSAKRWSFRPEAAGLLVVGSDDGAKRAESAASLAGMSYDLWDVRVEGNPGSEVLLKYSGKSVILPVVAEELAEELDDVTARAVGEFLDVGGKLLTGPIDSRTVVGSLIQKYTQAIQTTTLDGLRVSQDNQFQANHRKYLVAVSDSELRSAPNLAERIVSFEVMGREMIGKVTLALAFANGGNATLAQVAEHAILRDLIKEMFDDKAVDGENFKERVDKLQLTAFVNTVLGKPVKERATLVRLYPELEKARLDTGNIFSSRRAQIKKVLKPLKKAYEDLSG